MYLLERGAAATASDERGKTPLDVADDGPAREAIDRAHRQRYACLAFRAGEGFATESARFASLLADWSGGGTGDSSDDQAGGDDETNDIHV